MVAVSLNGRGQSSQSTESLHLFLAIEQTRARVFQWQEQKGNRRAYTYRPPQQRSVIVYSRYLTATNPELPASLTSCLRRDDVVKTQAGRHEAFLVPVDRQTTERDKTAREVTLTCDPQLSKARLHRKRAMTGAALSQ